jgi:nucleotide-binding universal stress UspA family protein
MGRDLVLPDWFGRAHPKFNTPANGILFTGGIAILLAVTGRAETLAEISSTLFMVSYSLLSISVLVLRRVKPRWYHPTFSTPLSSFLPVLTVALCLGVILTMDNFSQLAGLGLATMSLVWYFIWVRKNAVVSGEFAPMWERERPIERVIEAMETGSRNKKHDVLVPIWNKIDPTPLIELASAIALSNEKSVINVLDMVVTPPQVPLDTAQVALARHHTSTKDVILEIAARIAQKGVPIRTLHRAVRSPDSGATAFIDAHPDVALILTGWKGSLSSIRIYGSPTKNILEKAKCDVGIFLPRRFFEVNRILIPIGGGPHARLGLRLASQLAQGGGSNLTALRVLRPHADLDLEVETVSLKRVIVDVLDGNPDYISSKIVVADDVIETILKTAREGNYDLLVIGASEEWQIKSLLAGSLPDAIAEQSPCSVLLVRRYEPEGVSTVRRVLSSLRGWK